MFGINETADRRVLTLKKPKRRGDGARVSGFGIIITETRGHVLSPEFGSTKVGQEAGRNREEALNTICGAALAWVFVGRNWPVYLNTIVKSSLGS